ncbi:ParA family protein [Borreliella burgdorferi]|uniref:PF-32 protein n=1 Tax=Borreliella burgdorferi 297 TaxID=521009 RepID=A0A9N7B9Y6_BORBG|nr:ParA family protein [Borreliella burgdorferi]ADQ44782.1 PF-32 protein [Borreliella burgdorferi 297]MCR8910006.1 ParA family protein [Borreliella burgdorferi 297]PRR01250.1 ParA family protein [Borreliella burgdorferi]PRR09467.1 ParA family protein [Borreliella burgdorferi]PRR49643.1 ParA family protein [Borreliella burgdorferi]
MDRRKCKIICLSSIKGGVGKSVSAIIFAQILSMKYKVLLIDMDPQASISSYLYDKIEERNILGKNIYKVLTFALNINDAINIINENLDFIPSYIDLNLFNRDSMPLKELNLKKSLLNIQKNYEYIIIDTNPSMDSTLANALIASNFVLTPIISERWAVESFDMIMSYINYLSLNLKPFIFITRFKKNSTHKELLKILYSKHNVLGVINEREDLNRKIAKSENFDLSKDYIEEYKNILKNFLEIVESA